MGSTARRAVLLRRKAEEVEAWLNLRQVPRQLGARVTTYFADAWIRHAGDFWTALRPASSQDTMQGPGMQTGIA